ncbi:YqjK family protein [Undibacterium sp. TJN25]|uniref:YqjK family protein n=1 Tax=Undibacterium sp. TJN25 TaxID=3413056 RepID=UPI003BEF7D2A
MAQSSLPHKLQQRRQALLDKSEQQRNAFAVQAAQARQSLTLADAGLRIVAKLKQHPLLVAGVVAAAVIVKPRRLFSIFNKGLIAWRIWQGLRPQDKAGTDAAPRQAEAK